MPFVKWTRPPAASTARTSSTILPVGSLAASRYSPPLA